LKTESRNEFRDRIVEEVGEIPLTDTQKYRVLIVLDADTNQPRLSAQRWWRKSSKDEWIAGKGFKLDKNLSERFAKLMLLGAEKLNQSTY